MQLAGNMKCYCGIVKIRGGACGGAIEASNYWIGSIGHCCRNNDPIRLNCRIDSSTHITNSEGLSILIQNLDHEIRLLHLQLLTKKNQSKYIKGKFCVRGCVFFLIGIFINVVVMGSHLARGTKGDPRGVFHP